MMVGWLIENTLITAGIILILLVACRHLRLRPAVCHLLWVLVLVRLIAPPVQVDQWPVATAFQNARHWTSDFIAHLSAPSVELPTLTIRSTEHARVEQRKLARILNNPETDPSDALLERIVQYGSMRAAEPQRPYANLVTAYPQAQSPAPLAAPGTTPGGASDGRIDSAIAPMDLRDNQVVMTQQVILPQIARGTAPTAMSTQGEDRIAGWFAGLDPEELLPVVLLGIWGLGSLLIACSLFARIIAMQRRVCRAPLADEHLTSFVRNVADRLEVGMPRIRVCRDIDTPMIWCLGRPTLLWPTAWLTQGLAGREGVVAHELAHIRRRDHWVAWLDLLVTILMWWNPLMWFVRHRVHHYSELACDAWVVNTLPGGRRRYAESIIDALEGMSRSRRIAPALGLAASNKRDVQRRLVFIVRENVSCRLSPATGLVAVLVAGLLLPRWVVASNSISPMRSDQLTINADLAPALLPTVEERTLRFNATHAYSMMRYEAAIPALQQLIERKPDEGYLHHLLGICLLTQHRFDEAAAAFRAQLDLNHDRAIALYNLACCSSLNNQAETAVEFLTRAIASGFNQVHMFDQGDADLSLIHDDPRFAEIERGCRRAADLREAIHVLMQSESWQAAHIRSEELLRLTPEDPHAHGTSGFIFMRLNELDSATDAFNRQISLKGDRGDAYYHLACIAAKRGEMDLAMQTLQQAVSEGFSDGRIMRRDPDLEPLRQFSALHDLAAQADTKHRLMREAELAREYDDWNQVRAIAQRTIASVPVDDLETRGWAFSQIAAADLRLSRPGQSAAARREQIVHGYQPVIAMVELAAVLVSARKYEDALAHLQAAVRMGHDAPDKLACDERFEPLHRDHRFHRIVSRGRDRQVLKALGVLDWNELYERAATQSNVNDGAEAARRYQHLGLAQLRLGNYADARASFEQYIAVASSPTIGRYNMACAYAMEGHVEEAVRWLDLSLQDLVSTPEDLARVRFDPDLANLWDDARFESVMRKAAARMDEMHMEARTVADVI